MKNSTVTILIIVLIILVLMNGMTRSYYEQAIIVDVSVRQQLEKSYADLPKNTTPDLVIEMYNKMFTLTDAQLEKLFSMFKGIQDSNIPKVNDITGSMDDIIIVKLILKGDIIGFVESFNVVPGQVVTKDMIARGAKPFLPKDIEVYRYVIKSIKDDKKIFPVNVEPSQKELVDMIKATLTNLDGLSDKQLTSFIYILEKQFIEGDVSTGLRSEDFLALVVHPCLPSILDDMAAAGPLTKPIITKVLNQPIDPKTCEKVAASSSSILSSIITSSSSILSSTETPSEKTRGISKGLIIVIVFIILIVIGLMWAVSRYQSPADKIVK